MKAPGFIRLLTKGDRKALAYLVGDYHVGRTPQNVACAIVRKSFKVRPKGDKLRAVLDYCALVHSHNTRAYTHLMMGL